MYTYLHANNRTAFDTRWQWLLRSGSLDVRLEDVRRTSWIKLSASVHVALVDASGLQLNDSYDTQPTALHIRRRHGEELQRCQIPQIFPARSRVRANLLALRVHMYFATPKTQLHGTVQTLDPTSAVALSQLIPEMEDHVTMVINFGRMMLIEQQVVTRSVGELKTVFAIKLRRESTEQNASSNSNIWKHKRRICIVAFHLNRDRNCMSRE